MSLGNKINLSPALMDLLVMSYVRTQFQFIFMTATPGSNSCPQFTEEELEAQGDRGTLAATIC